MTGDAEFLLTQLDIVTLLTVAAVAFAAAVVSGMSGVGGGMLVAILVTPIVGVKAVVPTVGVAMLVAHLARVWVYRGEIIWRPAAMVLAAAVPATILGARVYVALPADIIAAVMGIFLLASVPLRRVLAKRNFRIGPGGLSLVGGTYGFLSGTTIGGGVLVISALLGAGLLGPALIATDAVVGVSVLMSKTIIYGRYAVLTPELFLAGCLIGLCMVPGTYVARWLVMRTAVHLHVVSMELVIVAGGLSFLWRAVNG